MKLITELLMNHMFPQKMHELLNLFKINRPRPSCKRTS